MRLWALLAFLFVFTVVIIEPYRYLNYEEPNVYYIDEERPTLEVFETWEEVERKRKEDKRTEILSDFWNSFPGQ